LTMSEENRPQNGANYYWRVTNKNCEVTRYGKTATSSERFSIIWQVYTWFRVCRSISIEKGHSGLSWVKLCTDIMKMEVEIYSEEMGFDMTYRRWQMTCPNDHVWEGHGRW
jgi:hypothetical protein